MKFITRTLRLVYIQFVIVRFHLDDIVTLSPLLYPLRLLCYLNPGYWRQDTRVSRGERLRLALETLGPIFIKAGQVISTRRDFLPDDIALELTKLQDQVPPFSGKIAQALIEKALNAPVAERFRHFDPNALASASIAQVHAATLLDGKAAVIKVLRPDIKKIIDRDVDLLFTLATLAEKYWSKGRTFKPREMVQEIAQTLYDEQDLMREAANASQLKRHFQGSKEIYIPTMYWDYCRANVLVMERIEGIPIHNMAALKAANVNLKKLAARCVEVFFTQVFRDSYFHADMHPGNIFVSTEHPEDPRLMVVDFGIMGSLNSKDQRYLAENLLAFFERDYQKVAELHIASGWLPPETRIDQFEGAVRAVCEPIFERPWREVSFGQLLLRLFQTARRFHINIQPQLILLQKTLLNVEGVGRQLDPDIDIWTTASPFLQSWMKKQMGPRAFLHRLKENLPYWSEKLPEMPGLLYEVLSSQQEQAKTTRFHGIRDRAKASRVGFSKALLRGVAVGLLAAIAFFAAEGSLWVELTVGALLAIVIVSS